MDKIFWAQEFNGQAEGGYFIRISDLVDFIKKVEATGKEVVGIKITENNNIEIIVSC